MTYTDFYLIILKCPEISNCYVGQPELPVSKVNYSSTNELRVRETCGYQTQCTPGYRLGVQNAAGKRLTEFCQENALVTANTLFQ